MRTDDSTNLIETGLGSPFHAFAARRRGRPSSYPVDGIIPQRSERNLYGALELSFVTRDVILWPVLGIGLRKVHFRNAIRITPGLP